MSKAYYNEFDKKTAAWLRELIKQGLIADGIVDDRSITDVQANDLRGFTQCHFFAGIGVWSYSLRQAGWSDDRPVWTGSCPCQPFSVAGKGKGTDDDRHLWPVLRELVAQHKPPVFFGEQVASKDGRSWLNTVRLEMEALGYGVGAADLCAAGVGAPHIRQREWFVAERVGNAIDPGLEGFTRDGNGSDQPGRIEAIEARPVAETSGADRMADANRHGCDKGRGSEPKAGSDGIIGNSSVVGMADSESVGSYEGQPDAGGSFNRVQPEQGTVIVDGISRSNGMADATSKRRERRRTSEESVEPETEQRPERFCDATEGQPASSPTNGHWSNPDWLFCRDGKWRPVEPGTSPLANGASNRVVKLRGYGNAIVSEVAQEFIAAYMET